MIGDTREVNFPRGDLDEEQDVEALEEQGGARWSTVKKSQARMVLACMDRNRVHVCMSRLGAGPKPLRLRRMRTAVGDTTMPRLASSPCIRRYPQRSFSLARPGSSPSLTERAEVSPYVVAGANTAHLYETFVCQRSSVRGVTMNDAGTLSRRAAAARNARSMFVILGLGCWRFKTLSW